MALQFESFFIAVKWLCVAFILFIAWSLWSKNTEQMQAPPKHSAGRAFSPEPC